MSRGMFITFEGGEGSGKTTQIALLERQLRDHGHEVMRTREPGGSPLAERIRGLLLSGAFKSCGPDIEAVLFAAARSDHLHTVIEPALERGVTVLCDRFFDSTRVYQAMGGASAELLEQLRREATGGRSPDLTVVLDVEAEVSTRRAAARRGAAQADRFESEGAAFHRGVRDGFLRIAREEPQRCVVVPAGSSVEDVAEMVMDVVGRRLPALVSI